MSSKSNDSRHGNEDKINREERRHQCRLEDVHVTHDFSFVPLSTYLEREVLLIIPDGGDLISRCDAPETH